MNDLKLRHNILGVGLLMAMVIVSAGNLDPIYSTENWLLSAFLLITAVVYLTVFLTRPRAK